MKSITGLLIMIALSLVLQSCASPTETPLPAAPKTPTQLQPTPVADALFQVVKPDGSAVGFSWDMLKQMPLAQVTVEGKVEEGVKLLDVLAEAGVTDFEKVTLTGNNGSMTLTRDQVNDEAILDFTNHGTVKQSATNVPKADWIKDITEIKVE